MKNSPHAGSASVHDVAANLPDDVRLAEILVAQDSEGRWPVRIVVREFNCAGKQNGYSPQGDRMHFSSAAMAALMRGDPGADQGYVLKSTAYSPLSLLQTNSTGAHDWIRGKVPAALRDVCPSGFEVVHRACLAQDKDRVIAGIVQQYQQRWGQERDTAARMLDGLAVFAAAHGAQAPAADHGQEAKAMLALRRESALLPGDDASAAAREALSVLAADEGASALDGIDAVISRLLQVRASVAREVAGPVVQASERDFDFDGERGVRFRARLVMKGDSYGFTQRGQTVAQNDGVALVEVFDARAAFTPHGQFTGSRHEISKFEEAIAAGEMRLSDQKDEWVLGRSDLASLVAWARAAELGLDAPAALEYGPMGSWEPMGKAVRGDVVYDVYRISDEAGELFSIRKEGEPIHPGSGGYRDLDAMLKMKRAVLLPSGPAPKAAGAVGPGFDM